MGKVFDYVDSARLHAVAPNWLHNWEELLDMLTLDMRKTGSCYLWTIKTRCRQTIAECWRLPPEILITVNEGEFSYFRVLQSGSLNAKIPYNEVIAEHRPAIHNQESCPKCGKSQVIKCRCPKVILRNEGRSGIVGVCSWIEQRARECRATRTHQHLQCILCRHRWQR